MNRNTLLIGGSVVVILIGGGWWYSTRSNAPSPATPQISNNNSTVPDSTTKISAQDQQSLSQGTQENSMFSGTPTSGSAPLTVRFTMKNEATGFYSFDFGDGTSFSQSSSNDYNNVSCTAAGPDSGCTGTHTYTKPGAYTATILDKSGTPLGSVVVTVSTPAGISATMNIDTTSSKPTISGALQNINGNGDLSLVIVRGTKSLPTTSDNPAKLSDVEDYGTSGLGGQINTDYHHSYNYSTSKELASGTYTAGLYLNTLASRGGGYHGFQLLTSQSFTTQKSSVTDQTINNLALGISFQAPDNWTIQNKSTQALDPESLGKISDGYGFSVSVSTDTKDNTAKTVYSSPDFSVLQSQSNGYHIANKRTGCFDSTYTKIGNRTVDGSPAVLFKASGGCDYESSYETLWIHGQTQDWYVTFEDATYPDKYPYATPVMESILSSIHLL